MDRKQNVACIDVLSCREGKFQEKILVKNPHYRKQLVGLEPVL